MVHPLTAVTPPYNYLTAGCRPLTTVLHWSQMLKSESKQMKLGFSTGKPLAMFHRA